MVDLAKAVRILKSLTLLLPIGFLVSCNNTNKTSSNRVKGTGGDVYITNVEINDNEKSGEELLKLVLPKSDNSQYYNNEDDFGKEPIEGIIKHSKPVFEDIKIDDIETKKEYIKNLLKDSKQTDTSKIDREQYDYYAKKASELEDQYDETDVKVLQEAIDFRKKTIDSNPYYYAAHYYLANDYMLMGNFCKSRDKEMACQYYKKAVDGYDNSITCINNSPENKDDPENENFASTEKLYNIFFGMGDVCYMLANLSRNKMSYLTDALVYISLSRDYEKTESNSKELFDLYIQMGKLMDDEAYKYFLNAELVLNDSEGLMDQNKLYEGYIYTYTLLSEYIDEFSVRPSMCDKNTYDKLKDEYKEQVDYEKD